MKPTEDKELKDRLIRMFNTATEIFPYTSSIKVAQDRNEIIVNHLLKIFEDYGYQTKIENK